MKEEIIGAVNPILQGSQQYNSLYVLIPSKLREKKGITEQTSFAVIEAENGDIIYRKQGD
ncbi:MAG: hypothetical protein NWF01_07960 [Candidatus Bathyarchaeota archaeon]|nr:hypothetical protein [Candidatus Bathyarchaeota archaeon]